MGTMLLASCNNNNNKCNCNCNCSGCSCNKEASAAPVLDFEVADKQLVDLKDFPVDKDGYIKRAWSGAPTEYMIEQILKDVIN